MNWVGPKRKTATETINVMITDIVTELALHGLDSLATQILALLDTPDLKTCQLVNKTWFQLIDELLRHDQHQRLAQSWKRNRAVLEQIQCHKDRAVCTVSSLAADHQGLLLALGGSGNIELWTRKPTMVKAWQVHGHDEGVYSVDMNTCFVVSGGDDATVKVWSRQDGQLLQTLTHHDYIVWNVRLHLQRLVTCSYDCSAAILNLSPCGSRATLLKLVKGPMNWADGLGTDSMGRYLSTADEVSHVISIWDLTKASDSDQEEVTLAAEASSVCLSGHTDEVHCVKFRVAADLVLTGSADRSVRLWHLESGQALRVFRGMRGKVWSVDMDPWRVVAGGRHGQIRSWSLLAFDEAIDDDDDEGDDLIVHSSETSVGQVKLEPGLLISADGLASVVVSDLWTKIKI